MTEPREIASALERVVDGVYYWQIRNSAIGGAVSSSHAVVFEDDCVLIDPVGLEPKTLHTLRRPTAIVLTATCHQRAAWRYRRELGVDVWLPEDARPADDEPDHRYRDGDLLPGGLRAVHTPGPEPAHYSLYCERGGGIVFCSDLVGSDETGRLHLVPAEYQDDPAEARRSIERLLRLRFQVLCLDHGRPVVADAAGALRRVLKRAAAPA